MTCDVSVDMAASYDDPVFLEQTYANECNYLQKTSRHSHVHIQKQLLLSL